MTSEERKKGTQKTATAAGGKAKRGPARSRASASAGGSKSDQSKPTARRRGSKKAVEEKAPQQAAVVKASPPLRLLEKMKAEVGPTLMKEFGYTSPMQIPGLSKVVLNMGLGEAIENPKAMESASRDLILISGQKPVTTRAKKSIAGFKIRQDMAIGLSVTLRGRRMFEFVDRLISAALPRIRDFQGVSREAFDGRGNYSLGIREQIIFPEIDYNSIDRIRGFQVVIGTTARTDREGLRLLELLGMPFVRVGDTARAA